MVCSTVPCASIVPRSKARPNVGLSCGLVFSGALGCLMRWVFRPSEQGCTDMIKWT